MNQLDIETKITLELGKQPSGEVICRENESIQIKASQSISEIKPKWVGVLVNRKHQCFQGRFTSVNQDLGIFVFRLDDAAKCPEFHKGDIVYFFDGYWGERVEIVLDRNTDWREKKFDSGIGIKIGNMLRKLKPGEAVPDGAEAMENGWDHEHCEICMETISEKTDSGFQNKLDQWICKMCFTRYYSEVSLGFIQT